MKVTRKSDLTGNESSIELDVTQEQLDATELKERPRAELMFPNLSINERLFVFTGITPEELQRNKPLMPLNENIAEKAETKELRITVSGIVLVLNKTCPVDLLIEAQSFLKNSPGPDHLDWEHIRDYRTTRNMQMDALGAWIENRLREPREYCKPVVIQTDCGPEVYQHFDLNGPLLSKLGQTPTDRVDQRKMELWLRDNFLRKVSLYHDQLIKEREPNSPQSLKRNVCKRPSANPERTPDKRRRRKRYL